ncbi:MAG: hypothetical protein K9H26_03980 [Prolixibacteraceae bacterium]|nr:hypothetical protein [Prolixibacteraceae bacterium]
MRITNIFIACIVTLTYNADAKLSSLAEPGHWNDPDMLEVGSKSLNPTECKAHFSIWCMLAAPLITGNDLTKMNKAIRDILTAHELIAISQDQFGKKCTRVNNENGLQVWQKPLNDGLVEKNSTINAKTLSQTHTDPRAKTGLMIRETENPASLFVLICTTPAKGVSLQWRDGFENTCNKNNYGK